MVTGAGAGIGRATALALAARRWRVLACDIARDAAEQAAADAGDTAIAVAADVTDDIALASLVAQAGNSLAAVIHCAALFPRLALADTDIAAFDRVMAVNLRAAMQLTLLAPPAMREGGSLIFLTSGSGLLSAATDPFQHGFALYGASKAALDRWTAGVAAELAPQGIFASTITPGARIITAERVAEAIVRIAEDRAGTFSGQRLSAATFGEEWD
ncbi:SDR family NAD(P)-dependent oxidoreductase [Sphingomonas sp. HITSZ_GF]|uniref:SDR family NAD(P)-dependent oxidoreductase n=1 Tax=Sphingomonas sp. HITSZ_GF TaxID=3037247 RepID=UPI00240E0EA7|nr:SDR family oxidoreductase [Sphingomonas sp. HITSZ_GF]MDG2533876.1 SDR family NAD(P)-dependent oxidoreductase [Sphingomonas sp. HITSZ_GF]